MHYRKRAELALGRPLRLREVVHHHSDTQLVICENQRYHKLLHRRMRERGIPVPNASKRGSISLYLHPESLELLRLHAAARGLFPSEVVRQAVDMVPGSLVKSS